MIRAIEVLEAKLKLTSEFIETNILDHNGEEQELQRYSSALQSIMVSEATRASALNLERFTSQAGLKALQFFRSAVRHEEMLQDSHNTAIEAALKTALQPLVEGTYIEPLFRAHFSGYPLPYFKLPKDFSEPVLKRTLELQSSFTQLMAKMELNRYELFDKAILGYSEKLDAEIYLRDTKGNGYSYSGTPPAPLWRVSAPGSSEVAHIQLLEELPQAVRVVLKG